MPELVKEARPEATIATGRSDYVNQVNNAVLPLHLPRCARCRRDAYHRRDEARLGAPSPSWPSPNVANQVAMAYPGHVLSFGPEYLIPKPFDPRLIVKIAPAVARAAMDSAFRHPAITHRDAYRAKLSAVRLPHRIGMRAIFQAARAQGKRIIYAEGEEERVARRSGRRRREVARPILIGRPDIIERRLERPTCVSSWGSISISSIWVPMSATANAGRLTTS